MEVDVAGSVGVSPRRVAHLAGQNLEASQRLHDAHWTAQAEGKISASWFGNTKAAAGVHAAYETCAQDAGKALNGLVEVFNGDVDHLYRCAFAFQEIDHRIADRLSWEQKHWR
jgi:hypothetical protein